MIVSLYLKDHEFLINTPQTFNFGGMYLYSFQNINNDLIVKRKLNKKYIHDFFNISESKCEIGLLSAVVGQNGVGKSSVLDVIRKIFVDHKYSKPHSTSTILVEVDGETKVLVSNCKVFMASDENKDDNPVISDLIPKGDDKQLSKKYKELEIIDTQDYQSIYYSPHFDLKYNNNFDEIDKYDISLDKTIKNDLERTEGKGTNENGWRFPLHEELLFKNSMRQIEFLNSPIFTSNSVFREVFDLPEYETGILHFRDVKIPNFHNTPTSLRPILELILEKAEDEYRTWRSYIKSDDNDRTLYQADKNKYLLQRFVIKAFVSVVVNQMEKENTWLEEGKIENPYDMDRFKDFSAKDLLLYFIKESYIEDGKSKKTIFDYDEILPFFEKLESLFEKENDPNNIKKQSIRLNLDEIKKIFQLHKKIVINLLHYFPKREGLITKGDYTDGLLSFRPTDRNMSSGENALLNFFSKLYSFIQNNLIKESKSLPDKKNYILLLDEADLGFHPVWKKRFVDVILKTLPYFFDTLKVRPKLQIIITTHDPLTLSDLPINNVIFLKKNKEYCFVISDIDQNKIQKTFGANISDLLADSFFVEDGLIGSFAKKKIKETIEWINNNKETDSIMKYNSINALEYHKRVISIIDEPVVKIKLSEMISELEDTNDFQLQILNDEMDFLKKKIDKLK